MKTRSTYIGWLSLCVAFGLWGAVIYAALSIQTQARVSATNVAQSEQQIDRAARMLRLSGLVADTKDERARLDSLIQSDVVSIVDTIEAAGAAARVKATVSDALPQGVSRELPGGEPLQTVAFVVQAQGSFSSLMKLVALFEHLPLVSSVEEIDLEQSAGANPKTATWHLTARIRVLTTAISS
ncbi:MAG: hypothetical protein AAB480_01370 [Patescibacteria group bacterium]